jgi:N-acetylglucosaminyldiphosphoundecaprenol N-acetyl-beta-D-mannosaminyltransferase
MDTRVTKHQSHDLSVKRLNLLSRPARSRIHIGSIAIDRHTQDAFVDEMLQHAFSSTVTRQVVTVNAQFYVLAEKSRRFRECLRAADYLCADGMPIVWACHASGEARVPRIAGIDLVEKLCEGGAPSKLRIFFLGGRPETASLTGQILKRRYPGIQIVGVSCPPFGFERRSDSLKEVLDHIKSANPHVLFAGLGAPKQEMLIHEHIRPLGVPLAIGIGGSFEILSGQLNRAPVWMRSSGLEWAYRLSQEPKRLWRRYLIGNTEFVWHFAKWRIRNFQFQPGRELDARAVKPQV